MLHCSALFDFFRAENFIGKILELKEFEVNKSLGIFMDFRMFWWKIQGIQVETD